jgi:hypothetical protein
MPFADAESPETETVWLRVPLGGDVFVTVTTNHELQVPQVDRLLEWLTAIRDGFLAREQETAA